MREYAINEIRTLLNSIDPKDVNPDNPKLQYICAMLAELAYYHVPQYEIDKWKRLTPDEDRKRAMLVPSDDFCRLAALGNPTDVTRLLREGGLDINGFVEDEESDGVIAVGVPIYSFLFIAFRGTLKFYLRDWFTNIDVRHELFHTRRGDGFLHKGFSNEAQRISNLLRLRIDDIGDFEHVFFTGHSLGGAVAAISEQYLAFPQLDGPVKNSILFGSPRYCDAKAYNIIDTAQPTYFRRECDLVPTVVPKLLGYSNPPKEFNSMDGEQIASATIDAWDNVGPSDWRKFGKLHAAPHEIKSYRHELCGRADAEGATLLAPWDILKPADFRKAKGKDQN